MKCARAQLKSSGAKHGPSKELYNHSSQYGR
jgi:hypothetical protein